MNGDGGIVACAADFCIWICLWVSLGCKLMTPAIAWLTLTAATGLVLALRNPRAAVIAFTASLPLTYYAAHMPLGMPIGGKPPAGRYQVHGARIDKDVAIYALMSLDGAQPRYYRLPYTESTASDLQEAMDAQFGGNGGGITAEIGESGGAVFHADTVTGTFDKQAETPLIGG